MTREILEKILDYRALPFKTSNKDDDISIVIFNSKKQLKFYFDSQGQLLSYDFEPRNYLRTFEYDDSGRVTTIIGGHINRRTEIQYREQGDVGLKIIERNGCNNLQEIEPEPGETSDDILEEHYISALFDHLGLEFYNSMIENNSKKIK